MSIKKLLLYILLFCAVNQLAAQEVKTITKDTTFGWGNAEGAFRFGVAKDSVFWIINRPRDNWFLSPRIGLQSYIGNAAVFKNRFNIPTPMLQVSIGKWFIPDVSFEILGSYSYVRSQSRYSLNPYIDFTDVPTYNDDGIARYPYQPFWFHHSSLEGALTMDFTNFFRGYYEGNRHRNHLLGSMGLGINLGWGKVVNPRTSTDKLLAHNYELSAFVALNNKYKLTEYVDLNFIFRLSTTRGSYDDYYGVEDHMTRGWYFGRFDFIPYAAAGFTINIGKENVIHTFIETEHREIFVQNRDMGMDSNFFCDSVLMRQIADARELITHKDSIIREQQRKLDYYVLYYPDASPDSLPADSLRNRSYMKHYPNDKEGQPDSIYRIGYVDLPYILYFGSDTMKRNENADVYYPFGYNRNSLQDGLSKNKAIIYCFIDKNPNEFTPPDSNVSEQPYLVYYPNGRHEGEDTANLINEGKPYIIFYPNGTPEGVDSATGVPIGGHPFVSYFPADTVDSSGVRTILYPHIVFGNLDYENFSRRNVPDLVQEEIEKRNLKAVYVFYELNKAVVSSPDVEKLREMAAYINADTSGQKYLVMGAADSRTGTPSINQRLSEQRCEAVCRILVNDFHVDPKRLIKKALGGIDDYEPYILNRICIVVADDPQWQYLIDLKTNKK